MALVVKDRVQEITTTTGTGTVTLGGAVLGYQSFSTVGNGNTTYYTIVDLITGDWEVGIGTYTSSGTTLSRTTVLSSSNAGSLVSFAAGTKNVFVTYPSSRSVYLSAAGLAVDVLDIGTLGTSTANISTANITAGTVSTTPVNNTDIVNKQYADAIASGIHFHEAVDLATTAALPANTYNNGTSGVGATLTATANGALSVDSTLTVASNRILVKNEATQANNGVYTVTQVGSAGTPYILTRATDFDTAGTGVDQIDEGDFFLVTSGTVNLNTAWVQQTAPPITVGTTAIVFQQFAAPITYTAGTGLSESPTYTFNIATTGVTAATYGSASQVPVFAVNAQGQITSVTNTAIAIAAGAVSGLAASATTDTTNASNITSGTLGTSRLSGSYTGITGTGALAAGSLATGFTAVSAPLGGTGQTSYAVGDLLYADTTTSLAKLADVAVGNALISGGVSSAPSWGKIGLATHVSGTLPVASGGTGVTSSTGTGSVVLSSSPSLVTPILGTPQSGNFSTGTFTWPTFNQNTTGSAGSAANLTGGTISGNYTVSNATSPNTYYLQFGDNTGWTYRFMTSVAGTPTTRFSFTDQGAFTAVGGIAGTTGSFSGVITSTATGATVLNMAGQSDSFGYNATAGQGTYIKGTASTYIYGGGKFYDGTTVQTLLHSGNYNSYAPTLTGGGASGTWGINVTGNAATATTASNSTNLGGYAASTYVGKFGNTYYQTDTWIQCNTLGGLYWPAINTAELNANTTSSYGAIAILGSRSTWRGIHFQGGGNQPHLMFDGSANGGIYYETGGRWASYYLYANNCWGFGTSTTNSAYNIYCSTGIYSGGRVDGTIFYDSNDTTYYVDPRSTSNIFDLQITGASNKYLYINPGNGWEAMVRYNGGSGSGWYVGKRNASVLVGTESFHFYSEAAAATVAGIDTGGNIFASGSMRAPIFYDNNNTGYYLDPAGTSQLSYVLANDWFRAQNNTGFYFQTYGYGLWAPEPASNSYGNVATYGNGRGGWSGYGIGSRHVFMSTGGDNVGVHDNSRGWIWYWNGSYFEIPYGFTQVAGSVRSPLFYDSDNTNYYVNPAGTSVLNGLTVGGGTIATTSGSPSYYMARAWVNFNGTGTVAIRASVNVSSITDSGTGRYVVNLTTAMPDTDYATVASCSLVGAGGQTVTTGSATYSTSAVSIGCTDAINNVSEDQTIVNVAIFR